MATKKFLFIGGTGTISASSVRLAVERGHDVTVLNRGREASRAIPSEVETLVADIRSPESVREALGSREFDAVAEFTAFTTEHVHTDIELFAGNTGQYVFISSASAYQTPPRTIPVTESTPLYNPFWQYSRDKIAGE
jgi:nucleoside-diphosphate-sugar epimerase